jgi:hypothetical protein
MSTNPDHVKQLAAIIREVNGSAWHPPGNPTQPEGEAMPHDLIRTLLRPAYEPGDGTADGAQQVSLAWWHPVFGSDSLQIVVDNARNLLACSGRSAALAQPEGEGPTGDQLDVAVIAIQALIPSPNSSEWHNLEAVDRGREILQRALARWGRPAAPPAPEPGEVEASND